MPLILIVTKKKKTKTLKDTREKDKACKTESRMEVPEHLNGQNKKGRGKYIKFIK